jgi:hypothetical protein
MRVLLVLSVLTPLHAHAQLGAYPFLQSAQACYLEASFRKADCAALLNVVGKRAGVRNRTGWPKDWFASAGSKFLRELERYSAISSPNDRARMIRNYPWADVYGQSPAFNARWGELRGFVIRVLTGAVKDPCPAATQWGARYGIDMKRAARAVKDGRWIPARCATGTANAFYAEVAR